MLLSAFSPFHISQRLNVDVIDLIREFDMIHPPNAIAKYAPDTGRFKIL